MYNAGLCIVCATFFRSQCYKNLYPDRRFKASVPSESVDDR